MPLSRRRRAPRRRDARSFSARARSRAIVARAVRPVAHRAGAGRRGLTWVYGRIGAMQKISAAECGRDTHCLTVSTHGTRRCS